MERSNDWPLCLSRIHIRWQTTKTSLNKSMDKEAFAMLSILVLTDGNNATNSIKQWNQTMITVKRENPYLMKLKSYSQSNILLHQHSILYLAIKIKYLLGLCGKQVSAMREANWNKLPAWKKRLILTSNLQPFDNNYRLTKCINLTLQIIEIFWITFVSSSLLVWMEWNIRLWEMPANNSLLIFAPL